MIEHTSKLARTATSLMMAMLFAGCSTTPADDTPEPAAAAVTAEAADSSLMTAAAGQAPGSAAPVSTSTVNLASDDVKCERMQVTGSHMYKRVCTTKAQREYLRQQTEEFARVFGRMRSVVR